MSKWLQKAEEFMVYSGSYSELTVLDAKMKDLLYLSKKTASPFFYSSRCFQMLKPKNDLEHVNMCSLRRGADR